MVDKRIIYASGKMAYCKKCGAKLSKSANYCSSCGSSAKELKIEEFTVSSSELVKTVKDLIHEGNIRRITVKNEKGKTLLEIPATVGVIGVVLAPWLAALGVIGAIATKCTIVVEKKKT